LASGLRRLTAQLQHELGGVSATGKTKLMDHQEYRELYAGGQIDFDNLPWKFTLDEFAIAVTVFLFYSFFCFLFFPTHHPSVDE
jgi:hypothetical protein